MFHCPLPAGVRPAQRQEHCFLSPTSLKWGPGSPLSDYGTQAAPIIFPASPSIRAGFSLSSSLSRGFENTTSLTHTRVLGGGGSCYHPHYVEEETEAQRGRVKCAEGLGAGADLDL